MDTAAEVLNRIEQQFGFKFIRTDRNKKSFDIFRGISEIFRRVKQSTKKTLINKISTRFLGSKFKSDNIIKPKAMKFIVRKYCLIISNNGHILLQL